MPNRHLSPNSSASKSRSSPLKIIEDALPFAVMLAIFVLYFWPILSQENILVYKDISQFAYPMKWYLWKVWALGEWPFWYPHIFQGIPFLPLMHTGIFYPPSVLFLLKDFALAFNTYFLFHHLVLMISVYVLSRYWGVSKLASLFSAVIALLGGYFLSLSSIYNQFHSAVWFPLILLFYQKHMEKKGVGYLLSASILVAFQVLGGGPESAIFSVLMIYVSSLFLINDENSIRQVIEKTFKMLSVVLLALGLSAVQWIPTFHFLEHLTRGEGISYSYSTEGSLEPGSLTDFILPENSQGFFSSEKVQKKTFLKSIYMGVLPFFILLIGMIWFRKDLFVRFWMIIFVTGIMLSLGRYNPLYFYIHSWVPFFDLFRYPPKFFFFSAFALIFLSGRGLDRLVDDLAQRRMRWNIPLAFLLLLAVLAVLIFYYFDDRRIIETLMILGLAASGCLAIYFNKMNQKFFLIFFLLVSVLDLMGKNGMLIPFVHKTFYTPPPVLAERMGNRADEYRIFRDRKIKVSKLVGSQKKSDEGSFNQNALSPLDRKFVLRDELHHNLGAIYNIAYADGRETMLLKDSALWENIFTASSPDRKKIILMRSNVKYQVVDDYEVFPSPGLPRGIKKVEEFRDALPRAFLVGRSIHGREPHLLNTYYDESFDPLQEVLLSGEVPLQTQNDFSGQLKKITYSPNSVQLLTDQNAEGFLVLLDTWFPGWEVKVDGEPEQIHRGNYFYRAVKLSPGSHTIKFSYVPEGFKMGLGISLLTSVLILAWLLVFRLRKSP